jgi:predicted TIM-barrel fold metal-dependent hydrolase
MAFEGKAGRIAIAALATAQSLRRRLKTAAVLDAGDFLMWASEYTHYDCEFPEAARELREHCGVLKPETQRKIMGENAARCYRRS